MIKKGGFHFETTYRTLPKAFFTDLKPEPVASPRVLVVNHGLATSLGLTLSDLDEKEQTGFFSGTTLPEGVIPFAQAYAGHQFGYFTHLGDGRAHIIGEHITPKGERFDIQLKGSGQTPYSRRGDGKAALGPMLREYILSEAMHHLGIPTTRSLAVVATGETVMRETPLPGAILTRVARSHIRFGTFELAADSMGAHAVKTLMDYTLQRHDPKLVASKKKALGLLQAVMARTADLVVHWMRVGFIHGVMNTDNMTLSGDTIDYGPCAFMDAYDPKTVFSAIDQGGRYAYAHQPKIALWNLTRLAETLLPPMDPNRDKAISMAKDALQQFFPLYQDKWMAMMRCKLGLLNAHEEDEKLVGDLLDWAERHHADYTNTFRDLSHSDKPSGELYEHPSFQSWYLRWRTRLLKNGCPLERSFECMKKTNPTVIPRNHQVQKALEAATNGDLTPFKRLLTVLEKPYENQDISIPYQKPPLPHERVYQTFCGT